MKKMKIAAITLASTMLFSSAFAITGCNKKGESNAVKNTVKKVEADSIWFDYARNEIQVFEKSDKYDYINLNTNMFKVDDGFVTTAVQYPVNWDDPSLCSIVKFDKNGKLTDKKDLTNKMFDVPEKASLYPDRIVDIDGKPTVIVNVFYSNEDEGVEFNKFYLYELESGKVSNFDYLQDPEASDMNSAGYSATGYSYGVNGFKEKKDSYRYTINLGKDGKIVKTIDLSKEVKGSNWYGCYFMQDDGSKILFNLFNEKDDLIISIDTANDMKIETMDWMDFYNSEENQNPEDGVEIEEEEDSFSYSSYKGEDGKTYFVKEDGVYCEKELIIPFNASYCNSAEVKNWPAILSADSESCVLISSLYDGYDEIYTMHSFTKADSNPNAGKTIIDVGCMGYIDDIASAAACEFNQDNDKYYVEFVVYDYPYDEDAYANAETDDDYTKIGLQLETSFANDLMMDLLNGEGPDMLINASSYAQLNDDDYLVSLNDFIDNDLSGVNLFDNVIEASKSNGNLYQLPLSFAVQGIAAKKSDVKGSTGFTFDEYKEYVDKVCNGNDPTAMYRSRLEFLIECIAATSDMYFDDKGNIDFKNDSFYEIAKYAKENVPEEYDYGYEYDDGVAIETWSGAVGYGIGMYDSVNTRVYLYSIDEYLSTLGGGDVGVYGFPSTDGRGPAITVHNSIAICAGAADIDGAKAFVKSIVTGDLKTNNINSISVDATRKVCEKGVDRNNVYYDNYASFASPEEIRESGMKRYDYDVIDDYINVLKSAKTIMALDTNIHLIVAEEIQSYFAGQKTIEEVADVIQDRAQTVVNERG